MSTHSGSNEWSPEEVDSLENACKNLQLLRTSPESNPVENGLSSGTNTNNLETKSVTGQSKKLHSSCDDLLIRSQELEGQDEPRINRSNTFINTKLKKPTIGKYDHVQSKIKQYFKNTATKPNEARPPKPKPSVISELKNNSDKEDYLEQINKQLTKELDEKNAILALLQENYEHLLFKYAEAQNRIDELRIKVLSEGGEIKSNHKLENHEDYLKDYFKRPTDTKCQKAVVAPFMKSEVPADAPSISRPSSLPLDNFKKVDKDFIKASTPTDSEGLSSVITSMSGHSKILNSLDEENQLGKNSNYLKYQTNKFDLDENIINDPFDKVKNWQNSLPPLEQIETPETALYQIFPNAEVYSSSETKYKDFSPRIEEKEFLLSDESCPDSWKEEPVKKTLDFLSVSARSGIKKKCFSNVVCRNSREDCSFKEDKITQTPKTDTLAASTIQNRQKRPPLLRCSSLPTYDQISVKSGIFKNGIYVPPLDLNNVTLSDDESYCQQEYCLSKSNAVTSSFTASRSIQTPQSFSSYKATITEESSYRKISKPTVSKSTSITPDRSRTMDLFFASRRRTSNCIKKYNECCKETKWCNVCGESIIQSRTPEPYPKSNSSESIHNGNTPRNDSSGRKQKPPFKRSVSFGSETITPKYCFHGMTQKNFFSKVNQDSLEDFDTYTNSLKARSDIVMKALTAHVNNCP